MLQERISKTMQELDLEIVHCYNKDKNQVTLSITPGMFDKIAEELHN